MGLTPIHLYTTIPFGLIINVFLFEYGSNHESYDLLISPVVSESRVYPSFADVQNDSCSSSLSAEIPTIE